MPKRPRKYTVDQRRANLAAAVKRVIEPQPRRKSDRDRGLTVIGKLRLPKQSDEAKRFRTIEGIIEEYVRRREMSRPLSIAVFGPPGSGKSFGVKEIIESIQVRGTARAVKAAKTAKDFSPPVTVNLSQLSDWRELAEAFTKNRLAAREGNTDIYFFDEFDAPLNGVSLGWLRWFLAPMQDGLFFFNGQSIPIGKAIFLFAGGTAETFEGFKSRAELDPGYKDKKVPDFISRLRGFIDIPGINMFNDERAIRRALVLRHRLDERWPDAREANGGRFPIESDDVHALLWDAHYTHGVRSVEALLDVSSRDDDPSANVELPDGDLRELYLSRGPLADAVIGISAGPNDKGAKQLLRNLTDQLLRNGAALAYGGDFLPQGTLGAVVEAARGVPTDLVPLRDDEKRIHNYLGFPTFHKPEAKRQARQGKDQVTFHNLETLSDSERRELEIPPRGWFPARPHKRWKRYYPKRHAAWALSLFRMRVRLVQDIKALIVVGGKDKGTSWGRFSGIAEEVMLALALRRPIYVLGGIEGAARGVGRLLGLDQTIASPDSCFVYRAENPDFTTTIEKYWDCFNLPHNTRLPLDLSTVRRFIADHSIATSHWTWNGLSVEENRELFASPLGDREAVRAVVNLIVRGMLRLEWKPAPQPSTQLPAR